MINLSFMADCSRNAVLNIKTVKRLMDKLGSFGYSRFMLYTEDTYEVKGEPYFGAARGRYSIAELKEIDAYAKARSIEVVPCVQTLAHLERLFLWNVYKPLRDCNDILLADDEKVYALIDNMFASLREAFTTSSINIGMDEADQIGLGRYMRLNGIHDRVSIMARHLNRICKIAQKHGFEKLMMWSDMFFRFSGEGGYYDGREGAKIEVPDNVTLIYWDYDGTSYERYDKMIKSHKAITPNLAFAGGAHKWYGFAPNNDFSVFTLDKSLKACEKNGIRDIIITAWGDDGGEASVFSVMAAAEFAAQKCGLTKGGTQDAFFTLDKINRLWPQMPQNVQNNFSKCLFYNDVFLGIFDSGVHDNVGAAFKEAAVLLKKDATKEYAYVFKTLQKLAEVLEIKAELGIKIRAHYKNKDNGGLLKDIQALAETVKRVKSFYEALKNQWFIENKPQGFEVQSARIGGLIYRLTHCRERLRDYINGKIKIIEELEEDNLDFISPSNNFKPQFEFIHNSYATTVTAGKI